MLLTNYYIQLSRRDLNNSDEDDEVDDGEIEVVTGPYPRVARWLSSICMSRSPYPDEDEVLWKGMASDVEEAPKLLERGAYSTGDGDGGCWERRRKTSLRMGRRGGRRWGFDFQVTHGPQPMFVLVPTDKMFPLTFGAPAQMQNAASNTPRARPVARHSTHHHSQQPRQQSYGTTCDWMSGGQGTQATSTRRARPTAHAAATPFVPSFHTVPSPSPR